MWTTPSAAADTAAGPFHSGLTANDTAAAADTAAVHAAERGKRNLLLDHSGLTDEPLLLTSSADMMRLQPLSASAPAVHAAASAAHPVDNAVGCASTCTFCCCWIIELQHQMLVNSEPSCAQLLTWWCPCIMCIHPHMLLLLLLLMLLILYTAIANACQQRL